MSRYQPYPEYKDSGVEWIGEVPAHWGVKRLKHVGEIVSGGTPKSGEPEFWDDEGVEWFTPADLSEGTVTRLGSSRRKLSPEGIKSCGADESPAGSIVISIRAPVGNIGILSESGATNQGCKTLVPQRMDRSPVIASTLSIATPDLQSEANGTTFQELSGTNLSAFAIPWPPIQESHAIATFLDRETTRIDTLIEKKQRFIELLEEKRQAVITQAVTKGLDPNVPMKDSGVEWIGEVPAHWGVAPIRSLSEKHQSGFTDGDWVESPFITDSGVRLIQTGNIGIGRYREQGHRYISDETFHDFKCTEVCPSDILICRLAEPVGRACLAPNLSVKMIASVDIAILKPCDQVDPRYLVYSMSSSKYLGYMDSVGRGGTRQRVSRNFLGSLRVAFPDHTEQSQIATFLDRETTRIDTLIEKTRESIERLKERRAALITAAVTGKIDVREEAAA